MTELMSRSDYRELCWDMHDARENERFYRGRDTYWRVRGRRLAMLAAEQRPLQRAAVRKVKSRGDE